MKKYVLVYVDTEDTVNNTLSSRVYDTKEEAQRVMQEEYDEQKETIEEWVEDGDFDLCVDDIDEDRAELLGDDQYIWKIVEVAM